MSEHPYANKLLSWKEVGKGLFEKNNWCGCWYDVGADTCMFFYNSVPFPKEHIERLQSLHKDI